MLYVILYTDASEAPHSDTIGAVRVEAVFTTGAAAGAWMAALAADLTTGVSSTAMSGKLVTVADDTCKVTAGDETWCLRRHYGKLDTAYVAGRF